MASRLEALLESIHPQRTLDEVAARADDAVNTFSATGSQVTDWDEFRSLLTRFTLHVEARCLRLGQTADSLLPDMEFHWGRCVQTLMAAYGPNGDKAAFEMARTGTEGGLHAVLGKIARSMVDQLMDNEISAKVSRYWDGLSAEQRHEAADLYLSEYGHLLPSELTEGSAARVRANMPKVLQEHPRAIQRLSRTGRS